MTLIFPRFRKRWAVLSLLAVLLAACAVFGLWRGFRGPGSGLTAAGAVRAAAQSPGPAAGERLMRFDHLTIEDGLSESVVNDILQDRRGFLWFSTGDGLNRFDGYTFTVYSSDPDDPKSLTHNHTTALLEDRQGFLWVGTYGAGLNRFDPLTGKAVRYLPGKQPGDLPFGPVTDILEDRQGAVWVAVSSGGLSRFDPQTGAFFTYQNNPDDSNSLSHNNVQALVQTRDGALWIATPKGLDRFDPQSEQFTHYRPDPADPASLVSARTVRLLEDSQGRLWVGTYDKGLDVLDPKTGRFTHYPYDPSAAGSLSGPQVSALYQDRAGDIWVGSYGGGLCRLQEYETGFDCFRHNLAKSDSLTADGVLSIYEDQAGTLWIGTFGGGISKLDPAFKRFQQVLKDPQDPHSLGGSLVFAVHQNEQGVLWVGMDDAGLDRVDRATGEVRHYRHDPNNPDSLISDKVHAVLEDHHGNVWVGTTNGLDRLDPATGRFTHFPHSPETPGGFYGTYISALAIDAQGVLWVTSDGALNRLDLNTDQPEPLFTHYLPDPANPTKSTGFIELHIGRGGSLWIGTSSNGLYRFDPLAETFTAFPGSHAKSGLLVDSFIMGLYEDASGSVWAGTAVGLNRLDFAQDGSLAAVRHYRIKDGLPNEFIYTIEQDDQGFLWMSTNKGLSRFDPRAGLFKNFDSKDGLHSNEFNMGASFKTPSGELIFGGINGVTLFHPTEIRDNPYIPPVMLTSLTQHGESIPIPAGEDALVEMRWPNNYFDFEFAALNYIRPEDNQYAYFLEGFDSGWNNIGAKRSGRYTNLPGGSYTLRLKGSNNDGLWNETGAALRVRVVPPLWQTWWFRGSAVLLVLGVVAGGVRLRVRGMESRNQELERLVQARTVEIARLYEQTKELAVVEERNRLARDLHDSAKQKAFAALAQIGAANGLVKTDAKRAYTALREAETLVYEVIEELTFLIQEMYPVALKEKGLANVLREYIFEWESRNSINVSLHIENECRIPLQLEQALYRITQEALANVARHSRAASVAIRVIYAPEQVVISVADDGQGFDLASRPAGVGLRSMRERVAMVGGSLTIESTPGLGTQLTACAPLNLPADGAAPAASLPQPLVETTKGDKSNHGSNHHPAG